MAASSVDDGPVHDTVDFSELEYDESEELYTYQCPCGDFFEITKVGATHTRTSLSVNCRRHHPLRACLGATGGR